MVSHFRDRATALTVVVLSAHFDHHGDDAAGKPPSAKEASAAIVMERARCALELADAVVVTGDMNTFGDRGGACYAALRAGAAGAFVDVRDAPGCVEVDAGRGGSSWQGWPSNAWSRTSVPDAPNRYDQVFVSAGVTVLRTSVPEERFPAAAPASASASASGDSVACLYASDHLPIVTDLRLPRGAVWRAAWRAKLESRTGDALFLLLLGAAAYVWRRARK